MRNNGHSNRISTNRAFALLVLAGVFIMALGLAAILPSRAWSAASGGSPNISAKAGSGGVTEGLFVTLSADGVIATASSPSDAVVGVCRTTAAATKITSYAPVGAQTTVTSGEAITAGDLLTAGTGGKAFVLDADDTLTQRICAVAVTSAVGANHDVDVIVTAAAAEQRRAITGHVEVTGNLTVAAANRLQIRDANAAISAATSGNLLISATGAVYCQGVVLGSGEDVTAIDANTALDPNASGAVYNVTADAVITLPATAAGVTYTFVNGGADNAVTITLDPNASDLIRGAGSDGADDTDFINPKDQSGHGDFVTITGDGSVGWYIQRKSGYWEYAE